MTEKRPDPDFVQRLAADPRWSTTLAVAPDRAGLESRFWPAGVARMPQGGGDLGDRMARALRAMPPGPVLIVGADIPGITPARVAEAVAALGDHDAVLGPAPDGGYWLIGVKHPHRLPPSLFDGVRWSSARARVDTIATLPGWRIAEVATLRDVDTAADL